MTGEVLLDEALKMIKMSEKMSVGQWVDLMSGECSAEVYERQETMAICSNAPSSQTRRIRQGKS